MTLVRAPILLNSCSMAATAGEARFRIDGTRPRPRSVRVVALDAGAGSIVARAASAHSGSARFLVADPEAAATKRIEQLDTTLTSTDGESVRFGDLLDGADMVVMVATADDGADLALALGDEATRRGIMTSGLVVADGVSAANAVAALRPHARVLLVSAHEQDLGGVLEALRA